MLDDGTEFVRRAPTLRTGAALRAALGAIADLIVPPCCLACRTLLASHHVLCGACWRRVQFIRAPLCDVTGIPLPYDTGERVVPPWRWPIRRPMTGPVRSPISMAACARWCTTSSTPTATMPASCSASGWPKPGRDLLPGIDVIVPVPMTRLRLLLRRFNQSAVLAHELGRQTGLPVDPHLLCGPARPRGRSASPATSAAAM